MDGRYGPGDVRFFDRIARLYDHAAPTARLGPVRAGLAHAERPVELALDLGGGTGRVARALETEVGVRTVVVDPAGGMLRRARRRGSECVRADGRELPVRDDSVDAVVIVDAFHHVPDPRRIADEVVRVLAPGGALVIREFNPDALAGRALAAAERLIGFDSTFTPPGDLARFLGERGFDARVVDGGFEYTVVGVRGA
jgi:demethylmenaquinone methyltransferase/2-methoxy-6-polyprenyl-1,4-benzoquinol methylase